MLGTDGLINPRSIGARPNLPVHYSYTLAGRGEEVWRPRFTYYGSRYLQVEGAVPAERAGPDDVAIVSLASEFVLVGATALTENWDPKLGGSQNDFMLGHALAWLYNGLGGITIDHWQSGPLVTVAPQLVPGLDEVSVGYDSPLGPLRSAWKREGGRTRFAIEIPAGAEAVLKLPVPLARLREGNAPAARAAGVRKAVARADGAVLTVGSGRFVFEG